MTAPMTASTALQTLARVCEQTGLDSSGATLLGPVGDNAVIRMPKERLVARVAWGLPALPRVRRELRIAEWLAGQDIPAVRPASAIAQPVIQDGRVLSFWEEIPSPAESSTAEMGRALRRLHAVSLPGEDFVGPMDPFVRQESHIKAADGVTEADRVFLRQRLTELQIAYRQLTFALPQGVIHGDPHRKNILRATDGQVVLLDLERFGIGPREWDLTVPAVYRRVGWYDAAAYSAFVKAYGWDVTDWPGFPTLAAIRELRMTTWLAARVGREPRLLAEVVHRIATLREPELPRRWTPGT